MAGLVVLVTALVGALAAFSDAATLHTREAVKPETIVCAQATGPFSNPQDCGSFLQCDASGNIVTRPCPAGLEFNAKLGVCDYPETAGCSQPAPVEEPVEEPAEEITQEPAQPAEDDNNGGNADEAEEPAPTTPEPPKCPAIENPEEAIQLPNPNDCNSFYKCDASGVAWLNACPASLEYNAKLGVCDYPENAGCSQPAPVEEPAEEPAEEITQEPAQPAEDDNNGGDADEAEEPAPTTPEPPKCPTIENPEEAIQLPNPNDCNSFYKCDASGVAWLTACPGGLEYNARLQVCDYPANAGCSQPAPVEEPVEEPAEQAEDDNNEGGADEAEEVTTPSSDAPECPAVENPGGAIQLANSKDCGSFYKCGADGVAVLIQCPAGLHYNAELRVCDYPASAGCSSA